MVRVRCGLPMSGISRRTHVEEIFDPDVVAAALILSTGRFCGLTYLVISDVREHRKWYDPCGAGYRSKFSPFSAAHILRDVPSQACGNLLSIYLHRQFDCDQQYNSSLTHFTLKLCEREERPWS